MTDFNDNYLDDVIVAEDEIDRETLKRHLWDGTWKLHCRDANGLAWFIPSGEPPIPEPDDGDLDLIAATMISDRPAAEPETVETPIGDIRATAWYRELHATGSADIPDGLTIRFADPGAGSVNIGGSDG